MSPFVFKTNGEPKGSRTLMLEQPTEPWQLEHIATFIQPANNRWLIEFFVLREIFRTRAPGDEGKERYYEKSAVVNLFMG